MISLKITPGGLLLYNTHRIMSFMFANLFFCNLLINIRRLPVISIQNNKKIENCHNLKRI